MAGMLKHTSQNASQCWYNIFSVLTQNLAHDSFTNIDSTHTSIFSSLPALKYRIKNIKMATQRLLDNDSII